VVARETGGEIGAEIGDRVRFFKVSNLRSSLKASAVSSPVALP
jgi:hypothetical protein